MADRVPDAWPRGMTAEVAAAYLGISETMLREESRAGRAPAPARIGRRVVWLREDLDAWLDRLTNRPQGRRSAVMEALASGQGRAALRQ